MTDTKRDAMQNVFDLMSIIKMHANNDMHALREIERVYGEMVIDSVSAERMELELASILIDGLRHDNWPWSVHNTLNS